MKKCKEKYASYLSFPPETAFFKAGRKFAAGEIFLDLTKLSHR